jgi:Carboxypeptidase regulatory-like domain
VLSSGQEFRATITGHVTDPSGGGIPGATVTAVGADTGQAYTGLCDNAGVYSLLYLLPGPYVVTVEAPGFQKTVYSNVMLASAQKLSLNVTLTLGAVSEQVTVTASPGLLDTGTASIGGVVDQTRVENMPSTGRQVWMNLTLAQESA